MSTEIIKFSQINIQFRLLRELINHVTNWCAQTLGSLEKNCRFCTESRDMASTHGVNELLEQELRQNTEHFSKNM